MNLRWIDASKALPTEGVNVIVCISTGKEQVDWDVQLMHRYQHCCWRGRNREISDDPTADGYPYERVTHWAAIPPKQWEFLNRAGETQ